ncbi:hypothetical protein BH11MYX3_BH11MYX3_41790 [soil metagenome]
MTRGLVAILLLAACGASKPPASRATEITANPPPQPPRPACIQPPETNAVVTRATGDAAKLAFCIGATTEQCFSIDVEGGKLERLTAPPIAGPTGAHVETINPELKVCTDGECKTLTPKVLPGIAALQATTNSAGTFAVVLLGDAAAGKGYAEVWDVVNGKRTASFKYARGEFKCGEVRMAGDSIVVNASTCGSPAARGALYSLKGKKIANVGGKDFGTFGNALAHVEGATWGFLEENGNQLAIQDVAKGKVIKVIDITHLWSPDGQKARDAMGNPGESALVPIGNGKLAVIAGAPSTGKVAIVDIASGDVKLTSAPLCH